MFERRKKRWSDLPRTQQRWIVAGGTAQVVLQIAALWDLCHRSDAELRGSRSWWVAASFVNFAGPVAYFALGRHCSRR